MNKNNIDYNKLRLAFKLLKENGIYHKWKINMLLLNNKSTLLRRLEQTKGNNFLLGSFCWSVTKEGHVYWEMWHKYFSETAK